jgi:hypothetical protein
MSGYYKHVLDVCQACGAEVNRNDIRLQLRDGTRPAATNYAEYSSYHADYWYIWNATSSSEESMGDCSYYEEPSGTDNASVVYNGTQTWDSYGNAFLLPGGTDFYDYSSYDRITVSVDVGMWQRETDGPLYVCLMLLSPPNHYTYFYGLNNVSTAYPGNSSVFNVRGLNRVWGSMAMSDLNPSADVTQLAAAIRVRSPLGTAKWFFDRFQIEKDTTSYGNFVATTGAAVNNATAARSQVVCKVCPECRERLLRPSKMQGEPRFKGLRPYIEDIEEM